MTGFGRTHRADVHRGTLHLQTERVLVGRISAGAGRLRQGTDHGVGPGVHLVDAAVEEVGDVEEVLLGVDLQVTEAGLANLGGDVGTGGGVQATEW